MAAYNHFLKLADLVQDSLITELDMKFGETLEGHVQTVLAEYDAVAFRYMDEIAQRKRGELISKLAETARTSFHKQMSFAEKEAIDEFEKMFKKGNGSFFILFLDVLLIWLGRRGRPKRHLYSALSRTGQRVQISCARTIRVLV